PSGRQAAMRSEFSSQPDLPGAKDEADEVNRSPEEQQDGWGNANHDFKEEHRLDFSEAQPVRDGGWNAVEDDGWGDPGGGVQPEYVGGAIGHQPTLTPEGICQHGSRTDANPIDYGQLAGSTGGIDDRQLGPALEDAWTRSYRTATSGDRDVVAFTVSSFTYVYDATPAGRGHADNRLIGVYGRSDPQGLPRDAARIAGFPSPQRDHTVRVHRGHAIGHQLGGPDEGYNLFPQAAEVNQGGQWRELEKYCADNPGTFMFVRAVYSSDTDEPAALEYGIEDENGRLVVTKFENL
ncbi:MAG: DNA/RNA non-specific endonuclease, partial [Nitrososphaerales archaeon]